MKMMKQMIWKIGLIFLIFLSANMCYASQLTLEDGEYEIAVSIEGGSGRASVASPALLSVKDKQAVVRIEWSSPNYDYMIVRDEKYMPVNQDGNSVFEIPVEGLDEPLQVVADTTAMSKPHEIEYTLSFDESSIRKTSGENRVWIWMLSAVAIAVLLVLMCIYGIRRGKGRQILGIGIVLIAAGGIFAFVKYGNWDVQDTKEVSFEIPKTLGSHLTWKAEKPLAYAKQFSIQTYVDEKGDEYPFITTKQKERFLVVPDGKNVYDDIPEDTVVISNPKQIYLVASQVMDMFVHMDAMDTISFSGTKESDWYIEEAKEYMKNGDILYAGKYSAPDYEQILKTGCDLTIENTMIYHTPEVKEKLESFKIPVLVDYSSYEESPLARAEWIKLYGVLLGKEETADKVFEQMQEAYRETENSVKESQTVTVAYFYISSNGDIKVRKGNDYMVKMIEAAGGSYVFAKDKKLATDTQTASTVTMSVEDFYALAKDADYIIYNGTIDDTIMDEKTFLQKNELLKDMKAVKEGHVYCSEKSLYQSTMDADVIVSELHQLLEGKDEKQEEWNYFYPLK